MFKLDTANNYTALYTFTGGKDGGWPFAGIVEDAAGNFYSTNVVSGDFTCNAPYGCGVVFKLRAES